MFKNRKNIIFNMETTLDSLIIEPKFPVDEIPFVRAISTDSTKEYLGILRNVYKENGILSVLKFEWDVTTEIIVNWIYFIGK